MPLGSASSAVPLAACLVLLASAPLMAQTKDLLGEERVEIAPFYGFRTGGGFTYTVNGAAYDIKNTASFGGVVDVNLGHDNFKLELLFSRQSSEVEAEGLFQPGLLDLTIDYYQAGVLQEVGSDQGRFYIGVLAGVTRFAPDAFDSEVRFSMSVGAGIKLYPTRHVGLRLDARGYATFVSGSGGMFCSGGCVFSYSGSSLWQGDFTGGIVFAF